MTQLSKFADITVDIKDFVATVEICRPPNNFFDLSLIDQIATAFETLDTMDSCRSIVLCAQGKNFCAGNDFSKPSADVTNVSNSRKNPLYEMGVRLFRTKKPSVGAIQGAAIGGGLGLALSTDFRVASPGCPILGQFCAAGFSPWLRPDHVAAAADRSAAGKSDALHRPPIYRRTGAGIGALRIPGADRSTASACNRVGQRNCRGGAAGGAVRARNDAQGHG